MDQKQDKSNVILIGMPAVGKSTLGVLLAKQLGFAYIDTDLIIQTGEQARLQEIIRRHGVKEFCRIEAEYVQNITARQTVIATGGSVVYAQQAMARLRDLGRIIFLDIEPGILTDRLNNLDSRGVVYMPGQSIAQLCAERRPLYRKYAQITIPCAGHTPQQLVSQIQVTLEQDPLFRRG